MPHRLISPSAFLFLSLATTQNQNQNQNEGFSLCSTGGDYLHRYTTTAFICSETESKNMDVNHRPQAPADLAESADVCRTELTRSDSDSDSDSDSSSITVDDLALRSTISTERDQHGTWTNEKHNSYLGALEASFVKQLHQSLGFFSCHSERKTCDTSPSHKFPPDVTYASDQRINFVKHQPLLYHTTGPRVHNMIQREKMPLRGKRNSSCRFTSLEHQCTHPKHPQAISTTAEVSDQNFVDGEREEKSNIIMFRAKRSKISAIDASTTDQIVPLGQLYAAELSTTSSDLSGRVTSAS